MKPMSASAETAAVQQIQGAANQSASWPLSSNQLQSPQPESHQAEAEIVDCPLNLWRRLGRVFDVEVDHE